MSNATLFEWWLFSYAFPNGPDQSNDWPRALLEANTADDRTPNLSHLWAGNRTEIAVDYKIELVGFRFGAKPPARFLCALKAMHFEMPFHSGEWTARVLPICLPYGMHWKRVQLECSPALPYSALYGMHHGAAPVRASRLLRGPRVCWKQRELFVL